MTDLTAPTNRAELIEKIEAFENIDPKEKAEMLSGAKMMSDDEISAACTAIAGMLFLFALEETDQEDDH